MKPSQYPILVINNIGKVILLDSIVNVSPKQWFSIKKVSNAFFSGKVVVSYIYNHGATILHGKKTLQPTLLPNYPGYRVVVFNF